MIDAPKEDAVFDRTKELPITSPLVDVKFADEVRASVQVIAEITASNYSVCFVVDICTHGSVSDLLERWQ